MRGRNRPPKPIPTASERFLSLVLIGVLALIALTVYTLQNRYDPGKWRARALDAVQTEPGSSSQDDRGPSVAGLRVMSAPEVYDAATLSDKINGKAELYLSAGFQRLETTRYALTAPAGPWIEQFVYTMNGYPGAYTVFSQQRRAEGTALTVTPDAYRSANSVFLVQGRYYAEFIASDASPVVMEKAEALAARFVEDHPVEASILDERTLFPKNGQLPDTMNLMAANAFGFDRFDRIFSVQYRWGDHRATAFLSRRSTAQEARTLAEAYGDFLLEYGGERVAQPAGDGSLTVIEILDSFEIVFHRGDLLAGVHEATDLQQALGLAGELQRHLAEGAGEK